MKDKKDNIYVCTICGNIVEKLEDSGVNLVCCGRPMKELVADTVEASYEKHIPVFTREGNTLRVQVGSVLHPASADHYINWIALKTNQGMSRKFLTPTENPEACFMLCPGEIPLKILAYCNVHGLWSTDLS